MLICALSDLPSAFPCPNCHPFSIDPTTGGVLFTWGGCFSWAEPSGPGGEVKVDHHKGCLGTGDREGRLLPTRIRGELESREVVQVWKISGGGGRVLIREDGLVERG